ncbi:MAG: rod shape-determining protein RodA [bacterium]|nr:rod shape-determining protein RodA [bacterium]
MRVNYRIAWNVVVPAAALLVIGVLFVYSASAGTGRSYWTKQIVWVMVGMLAAVPAALIEPRIYRHYAAPLFLVGIAGLVAVLVCGEVRNGQKCWLGIGGLGIQPSEFAKLAVILMFGRYLAEFEEHRYDARYYGLAFLILFIPLVLIMLQPDLGTAVVFVPLVFAMFYVSGTRQTLLASTFLGGLACLPLLWQVMSERQRQRILLTWQPERDPWGLGYQALQSKIAVGSGLLVGRGFGGSLQSRLNFLPERHTDFIFSVIGEEWGFLGCVAVMGLYVWLVGGALQIARRAKDTFGEVVAVGIATLFATHVLLNIGMAVGLLPVIGLPLPLISYGGSAMLTALVALGILQSISAHAVRR